MQTNGTPSRRFTTVLALCALAWAAFAVRGVPAIAAPAVGEKVLRIGVSEFPGSFHPNMDDQGVKAFIGWMTYRPITAYDRDWRLVCSLCTELPTRGNGRITDVVLPDGRNAVAVRYTIHPKASWGDGRPVTSRDVLFTYEVGRHPDVGVTDRAVFQRDALSVEAVDAKSFIIYRNPNTCTPEDPGFFGLLPEHLERPAFTRDPASYGVSSRYESDTANPGLWFGPYRVAKVEPGSGVVLERNPTWYGKKPYFDRIIVRAIENSSALEQALLAGDIDYVPGEIGFGVHQAAQLERRVGDTFDVQWRPDLLYRHIDLNHENPALADVRVRRALLHALNRELINDRLYYGRNLLAHTDIHPLDTVHDATVRQYPYNPAEAARLLDGAGWKLGADGIRRNAAGKPLEVQLWSGSGDRTIDLEQQIIQDNWRRSGITVTLKQAPARVLFGEVLTERRYEGGVTFSWLSLPRVPPRTVLHSSHIPTAENGWAGQNYMGYRNPKADRILEQIDQVCEPKANQALWSDLQKLYAEELPALPIFFVTRAYFLPKWLKGVEPTGHQFSSSMSVENWRRE